MNLIKLLAQVIDHLEGENGNWLRIFIRIFDYEFQTNTTDSSPLSTK